MNSRICLCAALALPTALSAQIVAADNFSYVGALTANGWVAHSGAGNKVVMANGATARLEQSGGSGEDLNLPFAAFGAADTVFASFTLNVPSGNPVNPDGQGTYFVHFKDAGSGFRARTGVLSPAGSGDFQLAMHADSADLGAGIAWPSDLTFDTDYTVVISWDAATGEAKLWLDPFAATSPSLSHTGTAMGTIIEQFALRQSNDHTGFVDVDDIVVGHSFTDVFCTSPDSVVRLATPLCATASLEVLGSPIAGNTVTASVVGGTLPLVVASITQVNVPLLPIFACDCLLVPNADSLGVGALVLPVPAGLTPGIQVFVQGIDLAAALGAGSPCDLGGLFFGVTDGACIVTG